MKTDIIAMALGLLLGSGCADSSTAGDEEDLGADAGAQLGPDAASQLEPDAGAHPSGGAAMLHAYAERGYFILYLTSRPADATLGGTGEPAYDATLRWLTEHDFPVAPERARLTLSPSLVYGDTAAEFKGGALLDMQAEGFELVAAYGNATSDIAAYEAAGIAKDHTFIIGAHAGESSTVAISGDGWEQHLADHVQTIAPACE